MSFQKRISQAFDEENRRRKDAGEPRLTKTDLWKAANLTSAAATFWFKGDNAADMNTCMSIAPLLRVRGQWLFDGKGPKHVPNDDGGNAEHAPIKMVDAKASAGNGYLVLSNDVSKILMFRRDYLAKNDAKPDDVIAFEVSGDSMIDAHIIDGAVVLANRKKKEPLSRRVYVLWIDGELFVKELINEDGLWFARSRNKARAKDYPDIQIDIDDRIVGQAFWCGFGL